MNNIEAIQAFERSNSTKSCRDATSAGFCKFDDIPGYFGHSILLIGASNMSSNRLEFRCSHGQSWTCATASSGLIAAKLYSRCLVKNIVEQTQTSLQESGLDQSYIHTLARLVDLVHPTHQLQASILANPTFGAQLLKKRILELSYDLGGGSEESSFVDHNFATDILRQLLRRLEREVRAYFEFSVTSNSRWRVGCTFLIKRFRHFRLPTAIFRSELCR